jgi:hypothetical protein
LGLQNLTILSLTGFDNHLRRTLSHVTNRGPPEEGDNVLARFQITSLDAVRIHEPFRDSVQPFQSRQICLFVDFGRLFWLSVDKTSLAWQLAAIAPPTEYHLFDLLI